MLLKGLEVASLLEQARVKMTELTRGIAPGHVTISSTKGELAPQWMEVRLIEESWRTTTSQVVHGIAKRLPCSWMTKATIGICRAIGIPTTPRTFYVAVGANNDGRLELAYGYDSVVVQSPSTVDDALDQMRMLLFHVLGRVATARALHPAAITETLTAARAAA